MEHRLAALERQFEVLKYPVVRGGEVLPPVGVIGDFISEIADPAEAERARRDPLPIPALENREYYSDSHARYWQSGLVDFDKIGQALQRVSARTGRMYDFGGSTGRVFRHFLCQTDAFEVWTSDFKTASYEWNRMYMPQRLRMFLNNFYPPVPAPDGYFDFVLALSVFTHIDELESPWLLELRRILKPGGLLYLTIHDEAYWDDLSDSVLNAIQRSPNGAEITRASPFPGDRRAFHFTTESYYSCNVFHSREYIRRHWGRFFEIVDIMPLHHFKQCVVLLTH